MKALIRLLIIMLFAVNMANAQFVTISNFSGTTFYGTLGVTVTSVGGVSSWSGCLGPPTEYWIGYGSSGGYIYTLSHPTYSVHLQGYALNGGEYMQMYINGSPYPFTAADVVSYTSCGGSGIPCYISGGFIWGPTGSYDAPILAINSSVPINSFEFYCVTNSGVTYHVEVDTTVNLAATSTNPCENDSLLFHAIGDSTGATYAWSGPGGFTSTQQNPFIFPAVMADTGIYRVIRIIGVNHDTAYTHALVRPKPVLTASAPSPICLGTDITFTSGPDSTGETFSWTGPGGFTSTLQNPIITAPPLSDSGYYTEIADWNGCKDTAVVHVQIIRVAVPLATNNTPICAGGTVTLTATDSVSTVSYSWSGPGGFVSGLQNPVITGAPSSATGIYTVTATIGPCSYSDTTLVTVNPLPPIPVIAPRPPVCSGVDVAFLVSNDTPGATYLWVGPNGFTSTVENLVITSVIRANAGNYSLTATYGGCSSQHTEVYLTVDSTPVAPTVSSNSAVCSDSVLRLFADDATAGVTYRWAGPALFTSTAQNPTIINAQTYMSGNYTVTATLYGVCSSATAIPIVVNQTPSLPSTAGTTTPVCAGTLLHLAAYATPTTGTYHWTGPAGYSSVIQNPNILPANLTNTGTYYVYEILNGCTSDTASVDVVVNITPVIPLAWSNAPVCEGDTLKLFSSDSTPGVTYTWVGASGFTSVVQNPVIPNVLPSAAGIYTVTATLGLCSSSEVTSVAITSTPPLSVGSNSPVCTGDTLMLFATSTAGNTFFWTGPYTFMNTAPNPVRYPAVMEYAGVYTVTTTEPGGCFHTLFDTVVMHQTPAPPWVPWMTYCQFFDAPQLTAVDAPNVIWYPTRTGGTGSSIAPIPPTNIPGIYFYYLTETMDGCTSARDSVQVVIHPKPIVSLNPTTSKVCPHESIVYTATDIDPLVTYHWYPFMYLGDTTGATVTATPVADVDYAVVAKSIYGCTDTATANVTVYPAAIIALGVSDSVSVYPGESYHITTQTNCTSLAWTPSGGLDNANITDPTATPLVSTVYIVRGATDHGCIAEDSLYFHVNGETLYGMPNAFSPGTGVNNEFKLLIKGIAQLNHFRIYNRWGQLMFETSNINQGWDGAYKGQPQPFGVYVYDVQAVLSITGKIITLQGNITLLR